MPSSDEPVALARRRWPRWTTVVPVLSLLALVLAWGRHPHWAVAILLAFVLGAAVLAAVHHAEVVAHRVGEPFGSLILAVAVTIIEVALILTLLLAGGAEASTLARDTVFSAVMITVNGILGLSILVASLKYGFSHFNAEGSGGALATLISLAVTCLALPTYTLGAPGPQFTGPQLMFAALAALALYAMFVRTQTMRHRDFFLPVDSSGRLLDDEDEHAAPPNNKDALTSLGLLIASLVAVVGLAKAVSGPLEMGVLAVGLPPSVVGVIIALLVLAPETLAAVKAARRGRVQTSINLALGSGMASVGLTIPALALASVWIDAPLFLGLDATHIALLALTAVVATLTVVPGRATRLQGGVHLVILAAYLFLAANP